MVKATAFDHLQVAMPRGEEAAARAFYGSLLGLEEIAKPEFLPPGRRCSLVSTMPGIGIAL